VNVIKLFSLSLMMRQNKLEHLFLAKSFKTDLIFALKAISLILRGTTLGKAHNLLGNIRLGL